ncbi:hypothetical protein F3Y22_tig00110123pilonHSYRG00014 [Hibiscus syriacus]|uniref:RNase H type-1 domain-containing protein n=1 Tax=Hibiscus syriacus TaxID=106335 RepID=A0A6A3BN82_HIBSY|nr:hypothetical protein F3Y22_tig00110123pilonHSYRG00014 [Hibiscus syriacus]
MNTEVKQTIWIKPLTDWYKVNTDARQNTINENTTCGRVIRDHNGKWIVGFYKYIGICSILEAKLWAVYTGMMTAWDQGVRQLEVETDGREAYKLLGSKNKSIGNQVEDSLAKKASSGELDVRIIHEPPQSVIKMLQDEG